MTITKIKEKSAFWTQLADEASFTSEDERRHAVLIANQWLMTAEICDRLDDLIYRVTEEAIPQTVNGARTG